MSLTIEQLKFAREIGATHIELNSNPSKSDSWFYRKDEHAYEHGEWSYGFACAEILDTCEDKFARIDFSPLDEYYADKAVDIAATGGELEYDPADAFKRPATDMVNHPPHYQADGIECIDAIRASLGLEGFVAYCRGNAIKYSWRASKKGDAAQDLKKAAWYLNRAADELTKETDQ